MHRREKSAIQTHRREIVDDLFLEEDLLAKMMREKLFTTGMIEDIKSQRTMRDKTHRLLELVQKRGPDAFSKFITILREDYKWLADRLEETYKEKLEMEEEIADSARTPRQLQLSFPPTPRETFPKRLASTRLTSRSTQESYSRAPTTFFSEDFEPAQDETDGQASDLADNIHARSIRDVDSGHKADACLSPIQALLPSRRYIHTASSPFPLDSRISHDSFNLGHESEEENLDSDDEVLYQDPSIQENRNEADAGITETEETENTDNDTDVNDTDEDKILEELFWKLYKINKENETETDSPTHDEFGQITLAMVHDEIDQLVRRVDNAETSLDQVYKSLGEQNPKVPIETKIQQLIEDKDGLIQQLEKEKREKESMVNDMYINQVEMKKINKLKEKNEKYEIENRDLRTKLEQIQQEEDKRAEELRQRITDLERERTQTLLMQPQQMLQTPRKRTTRYTGAQRRIPSLNLHQTSSFDLVSSRPKFSLRKK